MMLHSQQGQWLIHFARLSTTGVLSQKAGEWYQSLNQAYQHCVNSVIDMLALIKIFVDVWSYTDSVRGC